MLEPWRDAEKALGTAPNAAEVELFRIEFLRSLARRGPRGIGLATAIARLVGAMLLDQNGDWAAQRRCMNLETLADLGNIPNHRVPAAAAWQPAARPPPGTALRYFCIASWNATVMLHHIGIVACSAEGAALCYRTICVEGAQLLGPILIPKSRCTRTRLPNT